MKAKKERSRGSRVLGTIGYSLFLLVALAAGSFARWIHQSPLLGAVAASLFVPPDPKQAFGSDSLTLLVLGCDEDLAPGGKVVLKKQARSDMMLIAKLDFSQHKITGVSIPRDTACDLPKADLRLLAQPELARGPHRINAYHEIALSGQENRLTQRAVEYLLPGVHIDRVVAIDFDAFQNMIDLLGGVPVKIDKAIDYDDKAGDLHIHFRPGVQTLDGYNAMCFVRFRHADSDFVRQDRQKEFLVDMKQQMIRKWTTLPQVLNAAPAVLSNALSVDELSSLAGFAKTVPPQNIQMGMVPVTEKSGSSLLHLDAKRTPAILEKFGLIPSYQARRSE